MKHGYFFTNADTRGPYTVIGLYCEILNEDEKRFTQEEHQLAHSDDDITCPDCLEAMK